MSESVYKKVLIVGTVPYNEKSTSRAFDSYFHFWPREKLAQIFSNTKTPCKGHCGKLYQITDQRLLRRWFDRKQRVGKEFLYDDLPCRWEDNDLEVGDQRTARLYRLGSRKNSVVYLMRRILWKKKYWCTEEFNRWLDAFRPECVFLSFSDDFFIPQIALYVAERYDIPILSSIGDDYYFNYNKTFSPLYYIYKKSYRKLIRKVLTRKGSSAIYIGDKIRDRYNEYFGLNGKTVYLTSSIERREFRPVCIEKPVIRYFGNIRLGRNESLNEIGRVLGQIAPSYVLEVYSNEADPRYSRIFESNPNVRFCGNIPYAEVLKKTLESDIVIVPESFRKKDIDIVRYSLSTKVADSLSSGAAVLAYGSCECGAIAYAKDTGCIAVCTDSKRLRETIKKLIMDQDYQKANYEKAILVTEENHKLQKSIGVFEKLVAQVVEEYADAVR